MTENGLIDNRHLRLYTLGIVARKYGVRKSVIECDLRLLHSAYSARPFSSLFSLAECEAAFSLDTRS